MSIREKLNQKPSVAVGVSSVIIIAAVVLILLQLWPRTPQGVTSQAFFTDDDGASFYRDATSNIPPYDHNGKQGVRAYVYRCGREQFVGYMERYTPEAHKIFEEQIKAGRAPTMNADMIGHQNVEVKKPGQGDWVKLSGPKPKLNEIFKITCPDGTKAEAVIP